MMKWRPIITVGLVCAAAAGAALWVIHARLAGHWLQVHTGIVNESGPYYGFWSGFGSDLTEFGVIGAIATGVYQLVRKYNCHYPGCWRVGNHPAADGQFSLCYRHHPEYQGKKPTHELIQRLHREHLERQSAIHGKLHQVHQHPTARPPTANGSADPGTLAAQPASSGNTRAGLGTPDETGDPARHIDEPGTTNKVQVIRQ